MTDKSQAEITHHGAAVRRVAVKALAETLERWEERARNLGVIARAPAGTWLMAPAEAARKLKACEREIALLRQAIGKSPEKIPERGGDGA